MSIAPIQYVSKHGFNGDPRQSQLSFAPGSVIMAKPNQEGAWWWGACQGKEGWFPPSYVAPAAPPTIPVGGAAAGMVVPPPQQSMQQRMQQASFPSAVQQQQQRQPQPQLVQPGRGGPGVYGVPQQSQQPLSPLHGVGGVPPPGAGGYGHPAPGMFPGGPQPVVVAQQQQQQQQYPQQPQMSYQAADPFAGLDNAPSSSSLSPLGSSGAGAAGFSSSTMSVGSSSNTSGSFAGGGAHPGPSPTAFRSSTTATIPPNITNNNSASMGASTTSAAAAAAKSIPKPPAPDATAAAFARMGINPVASRSSATTSKTNTPAGSRSASPATTLSAATATSAAAAPGALKASSSSSPTKMDAQAAAVSAVVGSAAPPSAKPATGAAPVASKEEEQARKLREQEEARQKAQMRKEREEMRRQQEKQTDSMTTGGLKASGAALQQQPQQLPPAAAGGAGPAGASGTALVGFAGGIVFNPYDFLSGTTGKLPERKFSPIFRVPPFWSMMNLNTYIHQQPVPPEKLKDRAAMYEQLARALSFVSFVCAETEKLSRSGRGRYGGSLNKNRENPLAFLQSNHMACEACIKLMSLLPHSAGASGQVLDGLFMNFMNVFISLIEHVQVNQQLVLPGGWQQPDYTYLCLYIIRNCGNNKWTFTICNTGRDGLQYHPASFDPETGKELKQMAMTIWDIPGSRVTDSTFWTLLFRLQVYPSRKNNAAFVYTKLLPALNSRPLLSNLDQGPAEYLEVPNKVSAQSYHPLALLALTSTPSVGARSSKYATLLVRNAAVDLAYAEIENAPPSSMDPEDTRILKLTGRNLANYASTMNPNTVPDGTLGAALSDSWELLDIVLKKINFASAKAMDQYSHGLSASAMNDDFAKGKIVTMKAGAGSAAFPLFGRLRKDNYDETVKRLMGDPRQDPILIPPVLTDEELPPVATNYQNAASYLLRIADACCLLLQQRRLIKNSPAFAASAAQYALMTVLPMPNIDPKFCFWRKSEMRRETQLNLLSLIRRICRIYSASTARVQQSRGLIAIRSTALACGACVADAICRVVAVDDPSTFALHYSGLCEGPTQPFCIDAGAFDTLGSNLPIYDPNICSLRFQCLDYLRGLVLNKDRTKKYTIFNFDKSQSPLPGDLVLIDQLAIQLALQRPFPQTTEAMMNFSAGLISGRNGSIIEVLPEFEFFRDIVFHFKHAVSGKEQTAPNVPETHTWLSSHATLHWDVRRKEKDDPTLVYNVTAFQGHPQEFVERIAQQETTPAANKNSAFAGFLKLFAAKSRIERSRLSSADPTTVVNSCGEKFLGKSRAKPVSVFGEDDVLHLENNELPTFGNVLTPSDSERFIQFLTVPYIRIPLILDFFANGDPTRMSALKTKSLQLIVDASLFEPGRWKPADFIDFVKEVPVTDIERLEMLLATPHGTVSDISSI
jgi:Variant SH3 domain